MRLIFFNINDYPSVTCILFLNRSELNINRKKTLCNPQLLHLLLKNKNKNNLFYSESQPEHLGFESMFPLAKKIEYNFLKKKKKKKKEKEKKVH